MAKKYRTEREVVTIEIPINIFSNDIPDGVDKDKCRILKISAYPQAWRYLQADLATQKKLFLKIEESIMGVKLPPGKYDENNINSEFIGQDLHKIAIQMDRIEDGKYYRGTKSKDPDLFNEIKKVAYYFHALFRYFKDKKRRTMKEIQTLYGIPNSNGLFTNDPNKLTYFFCKRFYGERFRSNGLDFPKEDSFRVKYLAYAGRARYFYGLSPTEVEERINNPNGHFNVILEICRKLQK